MFLVVTGINLLLSTIAVFLRCVVLTAYPAHGGASVDLIRLLCRIAYIHYVGMDDYFMVAAWVVTTGMGIMNVFHISWGTGSGAPNAASGHFEPKLTYLRQHTQDLPLMVILIPTLKYWYAYQLVYPWALFFVKASILALYHRIFTQKNFRLAVYCVTAFVSSYTIVVFFVNVRAFSICQLAELRVLIFDRPSNAGIIHREHGHPRFHKVATTCKHRTSQWRRSTSLRTS